MKFRLPAGTASTLCVVGVVCLLGIAFAKQSNDPSRCMHAAQSLVQGELMYIRDYDETLPPKNKTGSFKTVLLPYMQNDPNAFICPIIKQEYTFNLAIAGMFMASFEDFGKTAVLQDKSLHPDNYRTIAYLDGHSTHGSWKYQQNSCQDNLKELGLSAQMYAQDYDEILPPLTSKTKIRNYLSPYYRHENLDACPITTQPYRLNTALHMKSLNRIPNPDNTWLFRDDVAHKDGQITFVMLSGRAYSLKP